jgi:hypothetical protein
MSTKSAAIAGLPFAIVALFLATYASPGVAAQFRQASFDSAEEASRALFLAVRNHDERTVTQILQEGASAVGKDEALQNKLDRERFVQKYAQMHRWVRTANGGMVLYIGAENWPFPIPLVSRNGAWRFDSDMGLHEIRYRRIGENELTAIALCQALVAQNHPGTVDATDGISAAVLAAAKSGGRPIPFRGYYFRSLSVSGNRFAAIAYPAAYRSSGVMTFIVDPDGGAYEKDLGSSTAKVAGTMTGYHLDRTWTRAEATP